MNNPSSGGESHPGGAAAGGYSNWESHLLELIVFKGKHGHCNVPQGHGERKLARFVRHVRSMKAAGELSPQWERRLARLGFDFHPRETEWMGKCHQVTVIFDQKRNSGKRATVTKAENKSLNTWLSNQRREYKKLERGVQSSMTSKRVDLLQRTGMNLNPWQKKPKTSSPIAPKAAGVNGTSTGVEFPTAGDGDDNGVVDVGSAKGNGETKMKGASKLPDDQAGGKSLTSTKRALDVQPTSTCASMAKSDVDSPARPATTEAPLPAMPPATTGGSNEAAAAPVQTTVGTPAGSNSGADANASDDDDDDDGDDDSVLPDFEPMTEVVNGRYHFTHNVRLTRHPECSTFGIRLQSPGEQYRSNSIGCLVQAVLPSCTAPEGAVQAGDRIYSVNGTATLELSYHKITALVALNREANPDLLVLSLRRELPEAEVAVSAKAAKVSPKPKNGTREVEGAGGTDAKEPGQSSAKRNGETKKKAAKKLLDDANGKSLTSTKTALDVQSNVAGLATAKAPPPATTDGILPLPDKGRGDMSDGNEISGFDDDDDDDVSSMPRKKTKREGGDSAAVASGGDAPPAEKEGPMAKKRGREKKGAGDASTTSSAGGVDTTPDLAFTSEKSKGETDVDPLAKATIGAPKSNLSEPDRPELGSAPQMKFAFIAAPLLDGRVAAEIVLNDVNIGSIFAEFVCKSANFVEKCEQPGMEFPDLELVASELFREAGQLHCEELKGYQNEWESKNRQEEAWYLQIKHVFIQETDFDTEEEISDLVAHVLHRFLRDPRIKRWKIAGYKTVHDVDDCDVSGMKHSGNLEEFIEEKWVERETQKNTQIGADARPFVRVGFQEIGAESSEYKGIFFLTKNMFSPETKILSHAQAVERKLRSDAPVDVEECRKLKLKTEFLRVILEEDIDDELDSRSFYSLASLHRAPEICDMDSELVKKLMPQIEEFMTKGADIKESHILHAAAHRHFLGLFKPMIEKGADVNAFDQNSMTPLMIVASNIGEGIEISADRSLRIIWDLISLCSANKNLQDRAGRTALGHYYRARRDARGIDREVGAPIKETPINKSIEDMLRPDDGPTEADKRAKGGN